MMGMLLLLLGMNLRLVFTELQVAVVGLKTVVSQLHGGVSQFGITVFECEHQCLLLQLLVLQFVGSHVEPHLLVAQFQLPGF